jgi:hypothetical protein
MLANHNLMFREGLYLQCFSEQSSIASNHIRPKVSISFSAFFIYASIFRQKTCISQPSSEQTAETPAVMFASIIHDFDFSN